MTFEYSRGYTEVFVIIIVILGAFLLSGGQLLFQNNTNTFSTSDPGSSSGAWSISYVSKGCAALGEEIEITAKGPGTGYVAVELKNGSTFQTVLSDEFKPGLTNISIWSSLPLEKSLGFNTNPWRIKLFKGGDKTGAQWSGGDEKASTPDITLHPCP